MNGPRESLSSDITPALEIHGVSKSFGGLHVIQDVSLSVPLSSKTALIGPNGAGKTTIFNLISGVYEVDKGAIFVGGRDITRVKSNQRISYGVARNFQNIRLMQHLTVLENLLLGQHVRLNGVVDLLTPFRLRKSHLWTAEAYEALNQANLADYATSSVDSLPYGIRKRVDLVRATLTKPKVLMLDEPAAGLNPGEMDILSEDLDRLSTSGVALLIVEHDMIFVSRLCDHVVVLNFGEKIAEGSMTKIKDNEAVREAYLGGDVEDSNAA